MTVLARQAAQFVGWRPFEPRIVERVMPRDSNEEVYCLTKNRIMLRTAKSLIREMEPEGIISRADIDRMIWFMGMLEDRIENELDRHPLLDAPHRNH